MKTTDARSLSADDQEALRMKAVRAVTGGMSQVDVARLFGVSRVAVNNWVKRHRESGLGSLKAGKRGRPAEPKLSAKNRRAVVKLIVGKTPDQLLLPFALWTREAVQQLLEERFRLSVSVWTVGRYLKSWGLTPQKPLPRAFEQNPAEVQAWLMTEYPGIRDEAKRVGAEIHWGDEMGLRSDHQTGRTYGLKGQTPIIPGTGQRFRCNMISTVTNRGRLAFMVFDEGFTVPVFIRFLKRLIRQARRMVFLIVDRHPVHRARRIKEWLESQEDKLRMFFLPGDSPELNPDELLSEDVKSAAVGRQRPRDRKDVIAAVKGCPRLMQRSPQIVKACFREKHVRYAAL